MGCELCVHTPTHLPVKSDLNETHKHIQTTYTLHVALQTGTSQAYEKIMLNIYRGTRTQTQER